MAVLSEGIAVELEGRAVSDANIVEEISEVLSLLLRDLSSAADASLQSGEIFFFHTLELLNSGLAGDLTEAKLCPLLDEGGSLGRGEDVLHDTVCLFDGVENFSILLYLGGLHGDVRGIRLNPKEVLNVNINELDGVGAWEFGGNGGGANEGAENSGDPEVSHRNLLLLYY